MGIQDDDRGVLMRMTAPGRKFTAITPGDDADNVPANSTLYITTGGTITVIAVDNRDNEAVQLTVEDGTFLDQVQCRRVKQSGTAATGIYAIS